MVQECLWVSVDGSGDCLNPQKRVVGALGAQGCPLTSEKKIN